MQLFPEIERDPLGCWVSTIRPILLEHASWRLRMSASSARRRIYRDAEPDDAVELVEGCAVRNVQK